MVSDRKLPVDDGLGAVAYYQPDVVSYSDYYPFGMLLDGRKGGVRLRNSFQGQEQDPEVKGDGNSINYKYRMHDPRVGRFFAVDPLAAKYPHNSPYAFSENRVIDGVELEGLEFMGIAYSFVKNAVGEETLKNPNNHEVTRFIVRIGEWYSGEAFVDGLVATIESKGAALEEALADGDYSRVKNIIFSMVPTSPQNAYEALDNFQNLAERIADGDGEAIADGLVTLTNIAASVKVTPSSPLKNSTPKSVSKPNSGINTGAAKGKYNYGKYSGNFSENADKIRKDIGVPDNWLSKASQKDEGVKFIDPNNSGNHVRVMPGRSNSQFPNSQNPYTVRYKNGAPVDKSGNKIPNSTGQGQNKSPDLHVPLTDFKF